MRIPLFASAFAVVLFASQVRATLPTDSTAREPIAAIVAPLANAQNVIIRGALTPRAAAEFVTVAGAASNGIRIETPSDVHPTITYTEGARAEAVTVPSGIATPASSQ